MPWIAASLISAALAFVLIANATHTSKLTNRGRTRALILAIGWVSAAMVVSSLWAELAPGEPEVTGALVPAGEPIALGFVDAGRVLVRATPVADELGESALAELVIVGDDNKVKITHRFQLVDEATSLEAEAPPKPEDLATLIGISDMGANTRIRLLSLNPEKRATLTASYYPQKIPVGWLSIALIVIALLAAVVEGIIPTGSHRTFLTVSTASAAAYVWMLRDGLNPETAISTALGAIVWSFVIGAVTGSVLPGFVSSYVPLEQEAEGDPDPPAEEST